MPRVIGPVVIEISGNTIKFTKAVGQASARMQVFQRRMKAAGAAMTRYMTLPLIAAGAASLKFAVDFNKAMANVATMIPGNIERVLELKKGIQALAIETGKAPAALAAGLYEVLSAFGDAADSMDKLKIASRAAVAGITEPLQAFKLLSMMTKAYGDTSLPAIQKASDLAFKVVKRGQTTFAELAASMGQVLPWAEKLGVEIEEVSAGFATMTGVTGNTSEVATQLAGALRGLAQGTPALKKALIELHVETIEELIASRGLQGAFLALAGTTDGTAGAIKKLVGRAEGAMAVLALTGTQAKKFTDDLKEMENALGSTAEAYKEQTEGINEAGHQLNQLRQELHVAGQEIGTVLIPYLIKLTGRAKDAAEGFNSLDGATRKFLVTAGILVAAGGPLSKMVVLFTRLGPKGMIIAGVIAAIGALAVGIKSLFDKIAPLPAKTQLSAEKIAFLEEQMTALDKSLEDAGLIDKLEDTAEAIKAVGTAATETSQVLKDMALLSEVLGEFSWAEMFAKDMAALQQQPWTVGKQMEEEAETIRHAADLIKGHMAAYWRMQEAIAGGGIATKLPKGKKGTPHAFAEAKGWFAELAESIQLTQDHLVAFADSWADTVSRAIVEGELLSLKLSDFFKHITQELLKMAIAMKVTRPLFDAVAGALNPGGGAPAGTGATWSPSGTEPPMQNWGSSAPISFEFHDHHAAPGEMEVTEKRGAGGARVFEIMVRDAWKKSFAANAFDSDLARMGAVRQGVGR